MIATLTALALAFGLVNGIHDAGNAIAAPIMTNALRPGPAVVLAAVSHVVGALVAGTAVAATVAGVVHLSPGSMVSVVGAALTGALAWNVATLWWGLPCSSGHCLVGALAGAALAGSGVHSVVWGGLHGIRPYGVVGVVVWLAVSAAVALPLAAGIVRVLRPLATRLNRSALRPVRHGEVAMCAALAFAHGSNDAQKTMGMVVLALLATGHLTTFSVPLWVVLASAIVLTIGTSLGGWRVVATLGRRIYPLRSVDGLTAQGSSAGIVLAASVLGAPVSTTDVVAPAVVGVGVGERWHHVRWNVVRTIALSWLVTLPVSVALGAVAVLLWRWVA